jgi:transposase
VHRFNAAGPSGLVDRKAPGRQRRLDPEQQRELARCLENGPELAQDGVARWRLVDLCALVERRFGVRYRERGMGKLARALGFSRISARRSTRSPTPSSKPSSKKLAARIAAAVGDQAQGRRLELWFQDESRIGQKGEPTRPSARRGSRPRPPKDQRHPAAYIFAAMCPASAKAAALVLPYLDPPAMNPRLAEISAQVAAAAHAVVILDQAGWHGAKALRVPDNISLLPLPPDSPELNPVENLWQFIKHNFRNARVFASYDAIVAACCDAWNRLCAIPGQIRSITTTDWAQCQSARNRDPGSACNRDPSRGLKPVLPKRLIPVVHRRDPRVAQRPSVWLAERRAGGACGPSRRRRRLRHRRCGRPRMAEARVSCGGVSGDALSCGS